jgi:hypothetical protein
MQGTYFYNKGIYIFIWLVSQLDAKPNFEKYNACKQLQTHAWWGSALQLWLIQQNTQIK